MKIILLEDLLRRNDVVDLQKHFYNLCRQAQLVNLNAHKIENIFVKNVSI